MYNGPADRIRRAHRQNPELSPAELARELNKEKPQAKHWNGTPLRPISPKYVSKILRRDATMRYGSATPKFKTGPKPTGRKKAHAKPDANKTAEAKTPAPANRRPGSRPPARPNRSRG